MFCSSSAQVRCLAWSGSLSTRSTRGLPAADTSPKSLLLSSSVSVYPLSRAVIGVSPPSVDRLLEDDPVLAFLELDRLVGDLDVAAVDLELALVVVVIAVDQDLDVERLALQDLRRGVHGRELNLGARSRTGNGTVSTSTLPLQRGRGLERIAGRGVAVGEEHDPRHVERRDRRRGHLERRRQVGPLAVEPPRVFRHARRDCRPGRLSSGPA